MPLGVLQDCYHYVLLYVTSVSVHPHEPHRGLESIESEFGIWNLYVRKSSGIWYKLSGSSCTNIHWRLCARLLNLSFAIGNVLYCCSIPLWTYCFEQALFKVCKPRETEPNAMSRNPASVLETRLCLPEPGFWSAARQQQPFVEVPTWPDLLLSIPVLGTGWETQLWIYYIIKHSLHIQAKEPCPFSNLSPVPWFLLLPLDWVLCHFRWLMLLHTNK